ncbi:hypothetical protein B0H11DRAFT_2002339 [Mycena galericulata]|nr:hypothetical protein B0H11DRAFT_2002339 [Mycena galericulata]
MAADTVPRPSFLPEEEEEEMMLPSRPFLRQEEEDAQEAHFLRHEEEAEPDILSINHGPLPRAAGLDYHIPLRLNTAALVSMEEEEEEEESMLLYQAMTDSSTSHVKPPFTVQSSAQSRVHDSTRLGTQFNVHSSTQSRNHDIREIPVKYSNDICDDYRDGEDFASTYLLNLCLDCSVDSVTQMISHYRADERATAWPSQSSMPSHVPRTTHCLAILLT